MAPSEWQSSNVPPSMTPTQGRRSSSRVPNSTSLPVPPKGNGNEDRFSEFFPHLPSLPSILQAIGHKLEGPFLSDVCKALQRAGYPDFLPPQIVDFCKSILHESTTFQHTTTQTAKPNPITPTPHPSSHSPSSTAVPTTLSSVVSTSSNSFSGCDFISCTGPIGNGTFSTSSRHHPSPLPTVPTSGSPSTHDPSSSTGSTVSSPLPGPSSKSGSPGGSPLPTSDPPPSSSTPSSPISTPHPPSDSTNPVPSSNPVTKIKISSPSDGLAGGPTPTESSTDSVTPAVSPIQSHPLSTESTQEPTSSPSRLPSLLPTSSVSISFPGGANQTITPISAHHASSTPAISPSSAITPPSSASSNRSSASSSSFFSQKSTVVGTFTAVGVVVAAAAVGVLILFHLRRPGKRKRYRDSQLVPQVDPDGIPKNDVANGAGKGPPMRQASTQTNSSGRSLTSRNSTLPILPELEEIRPEDPFATMVPPLIQSPRHSRRSWNNAPDDVDPIDPDFVWSSNDDSSDSMVSTRSTMRMTTPERLVSDPETRAAMGWILADERSLTPVEEEEDEQALLSSRRPGR